MFLNKGMCWLNREFTQVMNNKYHRVGHHFQGRYKATPIDKYENILYFLSPYPAESTVSQNGRETGLLAM